MKRISIIFSLSFFLLNACGTPARLIAFDARMGNNVDTYVVNIHVMNEDGSGRIPLTNDGVSAHPAWSPDGRRLAYDSRHCPTPNTGPSSDEDVARRQIVLINPDGSGATCLGTGENPEWSPDGAQIAFEDRYKLYIIKADGSERVYLTNGISPAWSPDGSRLTFEADDEIWLINVDGSNRINLTNNTAHDHNPAWSPDGDWIAFHSYVNSVRSDIYAANIQELIDSHGVYGRVQLTSHARDDNSPSWSPDGKWIAFHSFRNDESFEIYTTRVDGSTTNKLTNSPDIDEENPVWQPLPPRLAATPIPSPVLPPQATRRAVRADNFLHIILNYVGTTMLYGPTLEFFIFYEDSFIPLAGSYDKGLPPHIRFKDEAGQLVHEELLPMTVYRSEGMVIDLPLDIEWEVYIPNDIRYACLELEMPPDFGVIEDAVNFNIDPPLYRCLSE